MMRDTVTFTREYWNDVDSYIGCLEADNKRLRKELEEALAKIDELTEDSEFLNALRAAGVDNWEGFDYAVEMLREESI